jgi:hypothetical protein
MPSGRSKIMQWTAPVLNHLGPFGQKISLPMKKYTAKTNVASILRAIDNAREEGKETPDGRTWTRWLRSHPPSDKGELDPWGNPYYLHLENRVYTIGSAGPDGKRYNADDIANTVTF